MRQQRVHAPTAGAVDQEDETVDLTTGALPELPPRGDGPQDEVQEAVEETKSTVERSLERIRESRETLAESLKPIEELLAERGLDAD